MVLVESLVLFFGRRDWHVLQLLKLSPVKVFGNAKGGGSNSCPQRLLHELRWRRLTTTAGHPLAIISGACGISAADH